MKFTAKLAAFASALFLAGATYAASPNASSCPDTGAIKSEGLDMAMMITSDTFLTYHMSQYNTNNTWIFAMAPVPGADEDEALQEGNALLYTLSGHPTPEDDGEGFTVCMYDLDSGSDIQAIAIRQADITSIHQLRKFLHK
ncbi:DUF4949 domain-containing protein [Legionella erythra]|uniref:Hemin binding protein n=1 Tax=Legionella erythra TaxID=448 RepID=A0A0W0TGB9_LEGER|nr:DUF4949 domain-containing protein [Legionella erythra]KTC94671.1 hemin binding protein [Legionella erythra]